MLQKDSRFWNGLRIVEDLSLKAWGPWIKYIRWFMIIDASIDNPSFRKWCAFQLFYALHFCYCSSIKSNILTIVHTLKSTFDVHIHVKYKCVQMRLCYSDHLHWFSPWMLSGVYWIRSPYMLYTFRIQLNGLAVPYILDLCIQFTPITSPALAENNICICSVPAIQK